MPPEPQVFELNEPADLKGPRWQGAELSWELANRYLESIALIDPGYRAEVEQAQQVSPGIPATVQQQRDFVRMLGHALFALIPQELAALILEDSTDGRLRLIVREGDDMGLPWEYLWAPGHELPMLLEGRVDLLRCVGEDRTRRPDATRVPPLCLLPVAVQPEVIPDLPFHAVDLERDLRPILHSLSSQQRLEHHVCPRAELDEAFDLPQLDMLLDGSPATALHLAAHGAGPRVLLCDADGRPAGVTGARLGGVLRDRDLQLVVLSTCGGAGTFSHRGATAKLAADLGEAASVPWLLASRLSLSSRAARVFFPAFYDSLGKHGAVEDAVREGRRALVEADIWCFGGMVIYTSSADRAGLAFEPRSIATTRRGSTTSRALRRVRTAVTAVPPWGWLLLALGAGALGVGLGKQAIARKEASDIAESRLADLQHQLEAWLDQGQSDRAWFALEDLESDLVGIGASDLASEAWRRHRARLDDNGEHDRAMEALVRAYQLAEEDSRCAAMLAQIGQALADRWRWEAAEVVLGELVRQHPDQLTTPEALALKARLAILSWDLGAAQSSLALLARQQPHHPLVAWQDSLVALAPAHKLGLADYELVGALDLVGGGTQQLAFRGDDDLIVVDPSQPTSQPCSLALPDIPGEPHAVPVRMGGTGPDLVALQRYVADTRSGSIVLLGLEGEELRPASETWSAYPATSGVAVDLDGDGKDELYLSEAPPGRRLFRLDRDTKGLWRVSQEQALLERTVVRSDVNDLEAADVDRDGNPELLLAAASWQAFETQVVGWDPQQAGLQVEWRRKLGQLRKLALFSGDPPMFAAGKERMFPSPQALGAEHPWGEAAGIYYFQRDASDFTLIDERVAPGPLGDEGYWGLDYLVASDPDGDGEQQAIAALSSRNEARGAAWFVPGPNQLDSRGFLVRAFEPCASVTMADTGKSVLLVRDFDTREWWLLGIGDGRFPTARQLPNDDGTRMEMSPRDHRWRAAETIAGAAMYGYAAGAFERVADAATDPTTRRAARLRAAELYAQDGRWEASAGEYRPLLAELEAKDKSGLAVRAREGALEALLQVGDYEQAAQLLASGVHPVDQDEGSKVLIASLASEMQQASFDFLAEPTEAWHFPDPLAVTRRPDGLELRLTGVDRVLAARLPVYWGGEALRVELDLELETIEWSSGFDLSLLPMGSRGGDHPLRFGAHVGGGGGTTQLGIGCDTRPSAAKPEAGLMWDTSGASLDQGLHVEMAIIPGLGVGRCSFRNEDGSLAYSGNFTPASSIEPGRYELLLWTSPVNHFGGHLSRILISSLTLEGLDLTVLDLPDDTSAERASRSWMAGRPAEAPTLLAEAARDDLRARLQRAIALADAGAREHAVAELRALVAADEQSAGALDPSSWGLFDCPGRAQRMIADLVRVDCDRHGPIIRTAIGTEAWLWVLYRDASISGAANQADHETARRTTDDAIAELERLEHSDLPSDRRDALKVGLRYLRGRSLLALDRPSAAHRDLTAAAEISARRGAGGAMVLEPEALEPASTPWFLEQAVRSEIALGRLEAQLARQPQALAHARRALELGQRQSWVVDALLVERSVRRWTADRNDWAELLGGVVWVGETE